LFRDCNQKNLDKIFDTLPFLAQWIAMPYDISDFEKESLLRFRQLGVEKFIAGFLFCYLYRNLNSEAV
jgi:hypothetical protein